MLVQDKRPASLAEQVGRVCALDGAVLDRMRHEALTVPDGWVAEYGEFQSGGWWTLSLFNASGDPGDVTIADCEAVPTSLLERMPATRALLDSLGLVYMWVRLARLAPNSFLWEHRDYGELSEREHYRLHIPLQTNRSAGLVLGGAKVHLAVGDLWRLVPTNAHGACNLLGPDRIHLILDCYGNDGFAKLASHSRLHDGDAVMLPSASDAELDRHVDDAVRLARLGYTDTAERSLLRLFYRYALPEGRVYDLLAAMHTALAQPETAQAWQAKKSLMLGTTDNGGRR
ncbi:aspartyl/asparaginyl beta-hydroxylase domain-containing protein [Catellatospora sp. IY07-71]|uniref:aspartyl/asparaginyl beta-hydroxylase domain-containing protein n=1 Tax=Catellatospora sp. IY07-71 TaxID=2728827 RepID=UPI001BB3B979|nr:aspartyl/asparaginyl beta-hydroxylase domain-containing protein [Catellatospora sp. IY07-71]